MLAQRPSGIIVDVDGTLALKDKRGPYDFSKCLDDKPNKPIVEIVRRFAVDHTVHVTTGREDMWRDLTIAWLHRQDIPYDFLWMRSTGDQRQDQIVKQEIYEVQIAPFTNVEFVLDDRNRVVDMWRSLGLVCLQVAYWKEKSDPVRGTDEEDL